MVYGVHLSVDTLRGQVLHQDQLARHGLIYDWKDGKAYENGVHTPVLKLETINLLLRVHRHRCNVWYDFIVDNDLLLLRDRWSRFVGLLLQTTNYRHEIQLVRAGALSIRRRLILLVLIAARSLFKDKLGEDLLPLLVVLAIHVADRFLGQHAGRFVAE